jgi:hypothetical protein
MSPELVLQRLHEEVRSPNRLVVITKGEAQCVINKITYLEDVVGRLIESLMDKGIKVELPYRTEDKGQGGA